MNNHITQNYDDQEKERNPLNENNNTRLLDIIKTLSLKHDYKFRKSDFDFKDFITEELEVVSDDEKIIEYNTLLIKLLNEETPLIYLNKIQKEAIMNDSFYVKVNKDCTTLFQCVENSTSVKRINFGLTNKTNSSTKSLGLKRRETKCLEQSHVSIGNECYILIKGEIHCFDKNNNFTENLLPGVLFGVEGPLFQKRFNTVVAKEGVIFLVIPDELFLEYICPFSKFSSYLHKNITVTNKIFQNIDEFKLFSMSYINKGPVDIYLLLEKYKKINSCLHPKANSKEIDFSAWNYAIERLPEGIFEVFVFNLVNQSTKILSMDKNIFNTYVTNINSKARNRSSFKYLQGKDLIIVRDMETDVLDFLSNMCIHLVESIKLRNLISNPMTFSAIFNSDDDSSINAIEMVYPFVMKPEEKEYIKKIFGSNISEKLIKLCLHYQDYSISIKKKVQTKKDPAEHWIQNIWKETKELLSLNSSVDEIEDLIVDILQGSKSTLLSCLSPYIYKYKEEILSWAEEKKIEFKTKEFLNFNDRIIASSYYYFKAYPEKFEEKKKLDIEQGITTLEETFSTGVKVILINLNKINPNLIDPNLKFKASSKNHIIIHIGYTFGAQSSEIIKPLLMLFGSKARSLNIIGKAGALVGKRTDILFADKMFYDKTHSMIPINHGDLDINKLEENAKCSIHKGPILCVAGTILQNNDLLRFYKYVNGCVGIEMEGFFYILEVDRAIKAGILPKSFETRCFYYASDLPLNPEENLSQEGNNISWDEGIGSMLAIQRLILNRIFSS